VEANVKRQQDGKKGFSILTEILCRSEMFCGMEEFFFEMMAKEGTQEM
jgi:hypothetical protein